MGSDADLEVKVYYEDTDSLGVVYYANYLKYFERGRTELVESYGKPIRAWNEAGYNFAVYKANLTFHLPARLSDRLLVRTRFEMSSPYRLLAKQEIRRDGELVTSAEVHLVCLDGQMNLREFPHELRPQALS